MSIPGLGQIPTQPDNVSSTRIISLRPSHEWRFQAPHATPITIKLLSGTAEKDGIELALRTIYNLAGTASRILTWHGCELEVDGKTDQEFIAQYNTPPDNPANAVINLHAELNTMRAAAQGREGPRVLVMGEKSTGKTTLVKTLTSYATRQGYQPLVLNMDPEEGMLSLPGTLSAAVFATIMDVEATDGWGGTPTSGPSSVPVKLPLVYYFGKRSPKEQPEFYKELTSRMAGTASGRLSEDADVRRSGVIIDTAGVTEDSKIELDLIAHIVEEVSVNIIVVLGSSSLEATLVKRFANEKTTLGEQIHVVQLDKSDGVAQRHSSFMQHTREACIKEYFFGDARRALSPQIQQVEFDSLTIFRISYNGLEKSEPTLEMQHWTLAVMDASTRDSPETLRAVSVMGFVYVSDVDEERRRVKVLAPVSGSWGDRPLVWGEWPEPYINLLG